MIKRLFENKCGDFIEIEGSKIYYERINRQGRPVLLFLHGGFGTIKIFNPILNAPIFERFDIIGIDTRGHGASTIGSSGLTYERLLKDVEAVSVHLGIAQVTILGFSDRANAALRLAALGSSMKVEQLIAVGAE